MGLLVSGGVAFDPNANLDVQVREDGSGTNPWIAANTPPLMLSFGKKFEGAVNPTMFTTNTLIGGNFPVAGRRIVQGDSDGASVRFRRGGSCAVPLAQRFTGADALNGILLNRPLRQYLFQAPIRMTLQAAAGRFEMCLCAGDGGVTASGNLTGPVWVADQAINGWRWTPRFRQVNAGAITTGTDSAAVSLNVWHLLGIRYTEGTEPRIEWLLDDRVIFALSGDASMPTYDGVGTNYPGYLPAYVMSQNAGNRIQAGDALYRVTFIGN